MTPRRPLEKSYSFFICILLTARRTPTRYDANSVGCLYEDRHQQPLLCRYTQPKPALLAFGPNRIQDFDPEWIVERRARLGERHAMLLLVRSILPIVPFEVHCSTYASYAYRGRLSSAP